MICWHMQRLECNVQPKESSLVFLANSPKSAVLMDMPAVCPLIVLVKLVIEAYRA